jgi:hypothetical protein
MSVSLGPRLRHPSPFRNVDDTEIPEVENTRLSGIGVQAQSTLRFYPCAPMRLQACAIVRLCVCTPRAQTIYVIRGETVASDFLQIVLKSMATIDPCACE